MKQIYLDLDGVCADFDKKKFEIFGRYEVSDDEMWPVIMKHYPTFFADLDPMPDFDLLWNFVKVAKPIVLTALPNPQKNSVYGPVRYKTEWVRKHMGPDVPVIVCRRAHKSDYAHEKSVLIDDHVGNIQQFQKAGGIGILHKTAAHSIIALEGLE